MYRLKRLVYLDATDEEREEIYQMILDDFEVCCDLVNMMKTRAEEELFTDEEELLDYEKVLPEGESIEFGYKDIGPDSDFCVLNGVSDIDSKVAIEIFLSGFNKYLNQE